MATKLSKKAYLATFVEPMKRLKANESYKPVQIGAYVDEVIRRFDPPVTRQELQIHHVYLNGDRGFYHVLINYGQNNLYLVIVVDCNREAVHGHYLLDLNVEYGLQGASKRAKPRKPKTPRDKKSKRQSRRRKAQVTK